MYTKYINKQKKQKEHIALVFLRFSLGGAAPRPFFATHSRPLGFTEVFRPGKFDPRRTAMVGGSKTRCLGFQVGHQGGPPKII